MQFLDAGRVFRCHNRCLLRSFVKNHAVQMNDAIAHDNLQSARPPALGGNRPNNTVTNMVVVSSRVGHFADYAGDRLQQVGSGNDTYKDIPSHHREAMDIMLFHQVNEFVRVCILLDDDGIVRHHIAHLSSVFVHEVGGQAIRTGQELQPARTLALRADFAAAKEIRLLDDAHESAALIQDRQAA